MVMALTLSCTARDNEIDLQLVTDESGAYRGTGCISDDPQPRPLVYRGIVQGEQRAEYNLVIDLVLLGGVPDCRNSRLQSWCEGHECRPLLDARVCLPVQVPFEADLTLEQSIVKAVEGLEGTPLVDDAPDQGTIVRATFTVQPCDALQTSAAFTDGDLVGCMFSCPAILDNLSGSISLDLDTSTIDCLRGVRWCAAEDFRAPPTGE